MLDVVGHELQNGRTRLYEVVLRQGLIASLIVTGVTIALFFGYGVFLRLQVGPSLYPLTLTAIFVASMSFAKIAWLGWYNTLAVNSAYFDVVYPGGRSRLPDTAFGFYPIRWRI